MKNTLYDPGFLVGVTKAGIKGFEKEDMALIYSETPAVVAGTFTKNQVKAAPVILTAHRVKSGLAQAILSIAATPTPALVYKEKEMLRK